MKTISRSVLLLLFVGGLWLAGRPRSFAEDGPAVAAKPVPKPALTPGQIAKLVEDLGSETFAVRETATRALSKAGPAVIAPVAKAAQTGDLETNLRAMRILESHYTQGSLEEYEAAEAVLETLSQSEKTSLSSRAEAVLGSMSQVREERAIAALRKLHGIVKSDAVQFGLTPAPLPAGQELITTVILNKKWKGQEQGLKYLERLRFLQTLYVVEGVLPDETLQRLQAKMPGLNVALRGGACLGVGGLTHPEGCEVSLIKPESAADKAGLQERDLILAFDGKRGEKEDEPLSFPRLIELIKEHDAGDKVPLVVRRGGREFRVDVVLDEWK